MDNDPKKVFEVLKENSLDKPLQVLNFVRYKVGKEFKVSSEFNDKNYSLKMDKSISSLKDISTLKLAVTLICLIQLKLTYTDN